MYRIYLGKFYFFYKHKQFFVLPFCCVGLVVLIRVSVRVRFRVRVRVKITAGRGGCGLVWNDYVCIRRARSAHQLDSDILVSAKLQLYRILSQESDEVFYRRTEINQMSDSLSAPLKSMSSRMSPRASHRRHQYAILASSPGSFDRRLFRILVQNVNFRNRKMSL